VRVSETSPPGPPPKTVKLDRGGRVIVPRAAAIAAALLRLALALVYLWGFITQAFGVSYTNSVTNSAGKAFSYGWHFSYDSGMGWITSGFAHSPTAAFIGGTHGPLAFIPKDLPTGLDDFGWMFALGGLAVALLFGICMRIAGWGGFLLNILLWFSLFPPSGNPVVDGTHTTYAFCFLLLMFLHAGNYVGLGRWWEAHTPALIHWPHAGAPAVPILAALP
jgi:thiosulfate dehydrogenase [quinone] large subunit